MTRKLVIEISEGEGKTHLLKRRDGIDKLLANIDMMFKRDRIVRAVKGVKVFFMDDGETAPVPAPVKTEDAVFLTEEELREVAGVGVEDEEEDGE